MRILVIEDDSVLCEVMRRSLSETGHRVDVATTVSQAEHFWRIQSYDAVLLDLNLPQDSRAGSVRGSGLDVLRAARARGDRTPVVVLTARDRTQERIAGLDAGADDYLGKPFDLAEVEARLRALARRVSGSSNMSEVGVLRLDRMSRRFSLGEEALVLPAREFEVLWELMSPPGRVVSKKALSDKLSDFDDSLGDNALEAFISRLRKKLASSGAQIRTLRGLGYLIEPQTDAAPGSVQAAPAWERD